MWVFEGITSYYDDLALVRSGLIGADSYLELLGQTITRVIRSHGRFRQSVEESSYDAWTKFYKRDENATNAIVSYYSKGSLIALALDLTLRSQTADSYSLDAVMQECWRRYGETGEGMPETGLESVAADIAGIDLTDFFESFVRGTVDLPLGALLAEVGVQYHLRPAHGQQDVGGNRGNASKVPATWLGASLSPASGRDVFAAVHANGPAEKAGLAAGDIAVALDNHKMTAANLSDRLREYHDGDDATLTVFRRDELMRIHIKLSTPPADTCYLILDEECTDEQLQRRRAWLETDNGVESLAGRPATKA